MAERQDNHKNNLFHNFGSNHERPIQQVGYYRCSLEDLVKDVGHEVNQKLKDMGARRILVKDETTPLNTTVFHKKESRGPPLAKPRYLVHILSNSTQQKDVATRTATQLLHKLYSASVLPELQGNLNFGNATKEYHTRVLIEQIISHPFSLHVVIFAPESEKKGEEILIYFVGVAAITYCS